MSFSSLERAVKAYQQHMPATAGQPLNLASLPVGECYMELMYVGIPSFLFDDNFQIDTMIKLVYSVCHHPLHGHNLVPDSNLPGEGCVEGYVVE